MSNEPLERERRYLYRLAISVDERTVWLAAAMAAAAAVWVAYLLTHPYPAYAGGLYLKIAEQISANGYGLPETIPGYTSDGVPFAYPPLMFYVTAVLVDLTGVEPLALVRYLPGLVVVASLVPFYGIAEELLPDARQAGLATLLFGLTPTVLRWHLSAGGLVRAPAFLLSLTGVYTGLKLFTTDDRRWLVASTAVFGLLVLTHPTYSTFLVLSYLLFYAAFDRSVDGLLEGAAVGFGGLLLAAPWWVQVVSTHGVGIYATAAGTHGGLAGGPYRLAVELTYALDNFDVEWPFYVGAYLGGAYYLYTRRFVLPAWLVASSYVIGKNRFLFVAGSMLTAALVFEVVVPRIRRSRLDATRARTASVAAVGLVVLVAVTAGTLYGAGAVAAAHEGSASQPAYMDDEDREAMRWISVNTAPSDRFVVLGDAAEWLPVFTDRTILVGPWGVEWESTRGYYHQFHFYDAVSACDDAACVTAALDREGVHPDYVYVPKGHYTIRGDGHVQSPAMADSLERSERYSVVYENEGVIVARVDGPDGALEDASGERATA